MTISAGMSWPCECGEVFDTCEARLGHRIEAHEGRERPSDESLHRMVAFLESLRESEQASLNWGLSRLRNRRVLDLLSHATYCQCQCQD